NFDVYLGPSNFAPGSLSTSPAANQGAGTMQVRSGPLTFPANSFPGGSSPNAFGPEITFSTPYTYTGGDLLLTLRYTAASGQLLFDFQNTPDAQFRSAFDYNATTMPDSSPGSYVLKFTASSLPAVPEPSSWLLGT